MFGSLINEAHLTFNLHTKTPLSIHSTYGNMLNPALPDMQCIRSRYQGEDTVIIPGSSLKGVIRSRFEKITEVFGGKCCPVTNRMASCKVDRKEFKHDKGMTYAEFVYNRMCPACKLFGSTSIASRILIADAYPTGECVLGERTGVGINRITGAAQSSALYDMEVVEDGTFKAEITVKNYELYQLALLLYVLKDMDDGYTMLGSSTSRGYGRMEIKNINMSFREYRKAVKGIKGFLGGQELYPEQSFNYRWEFPYFGEAQLSDMTIDDAPIVFKNVDISNALKYKEKLNVR